MRKHIDNDSKKNEIRMLLKHPSYNGKVIAILEGDTDLRLFRSLLNEDYVKVESAMGRASVNNIVCDLIAEEEYAHRLFGICDADFDHLVGGVHQCSVVFLTDTHDAEIMMINSPAVKDLIAEYGANAEAISILREGLVRTTLDTAFEIGIFRYINHIYELNINFKGIFIDYYLHIDGTTLQLDTDKLSHALVERSTSLKEGIDASYLLTKYNEHREDHSDRLQMCNGHDATKIISYILSQRKLSNDIQINQEKVERALRLSYKADYFKSTLLYKLLSNWRDTHSAMAFLN